MQVLLEPNVIHTTRTTDIKAVFTKTDDGTPTAGATITVELLDGATLITGSNLTLTDDGAGKYSQVFPIFTVGGQPLIKGKTYRLKYTVTLGGVPVIENETQEVVAV